MYGKSLIAAAIVVAASAAQASEPSVWDRAVEPIGEVRAISVYRSPSCGCCGGWIEHLERHGFEVSDHKVEDMVSVRDWHGVPQPLGSCHTAVIDGYVIEGHVPADDIKRLLRERPAVAGLTAPGMPVGAPGMEVPGRNDAFTVYGFGADGTTKIFSEHRDY